MGKMISRRNLRAAAAIAPSAVTMPWSALAADETQWRKVSGLLDPPSAGIIQLENGQFEAMARSTRLAFEQHTARVNRETSLWTRGALTTVSPRCEPAPLTYCRLIPTRSRSPRGGTESMVTLINGR